MKAKQPERIHWNIPKMWNGGECWIIGGGPSMPRQFGVPEDLINKVFDRELPMSAFSPYLSPIHDKHVIGVNMAFKLGDWVDLVYFGDGGFYFKNKVELLEFPKPRITCNPGVAKNAAVIGVKYVPRDGRVALGLTTRGNYVSWNRNTGASAINLATQMGAKRVFLLGFDMSLDKQSRQHWHSAYPTAKRKNVDAQRLPFKRHLACFPAIRNDADRLGIEVLNVNPNSQIKEFPRITLKEALEWQK